MKLLPIRKASPLPRTRKPKPFKIPLNIPPPPSLVALCRRAFAAGVPAKRVSSVIRDVLNEHKAIAHRAKKRGRARGGGQSSKAKGRSAVQLVRNALLDHATMARVKLTEDDIFVKTTSQGGCDIHLSPAAFNLFPFAIEAKNVEALNIWMALAQAEQNAKRQKKGAPGIVFFKRARSPLYVALRAEDFFAGLRG